MKSDLYTKIVLTFIAVVLSGILCQNLGLLRIHPVRVSVENEVDANVTNTVQVSGNVDVDNTVDVNLESVSPRATPIEVQIDH